MYHRFRNMNLWVELRFSLLNQFTLERRCKCPDVSEVYNVSVLNVLFCYLSCKSENSLDFCTCERCSVCHFITETTMINSLSSCRMRLHNDFPFQISNCSFTLL